MKYRLSAIFVFLFIYLLTSCTPVKYGYFETEEGLETCLNDLTENSSSFSALSDEIAFVIPGSREYIRAEKNNTLLRIRLYKSYSFEKSETEVSRTVIVKKELHIPLTDFRNTETDAETEDIIDGKYKTDIPENIKLPRKGLSFNGMYPDNPDYRLFNEIRLSAAIPEKTSKKQKNIINSWINEIKTDSLTKNQEKENAGEITAAAGAGNNKKITWLGAVGDIMPARGVQDILISDKKGIEKIFSDTLPILKSHDLLIGNLEGPVTYNKTAIEKAYNFKFRHPVLGELKKAGFDYLTAVNNHCFDFEEQGFLDTLNNLELYKIKTSGAGRNLSEALEPAHFTIGGTDFSILALADYPAEKDKFEGRKETQAADKKPGILWPSSPVFNAVKKMSSEKGISIVSVHGGYEWQNQPAAGQKKLYRKLAGLGADIIIGSHPHVLQPVEERNGSLIIYSLGNFIFPGMDETEYGEESMILSIGFYAGKPLYINYIPVNINGKYLSADKSGKILKRFSELNSVFSTKEKS